MLLKTHFEVAFSFWLSLYRKLFCLKLTLVSRGEYFAKLNVIE